MDELSLLPLGTSDFATLRLRNQIYVDKSALIYKIAIRPGKFFLANHSSSLDLETSKA